MELSDSTMDKWYRELWHVHGKAGVGPAQDTIIWAVSSVCLPRRYHINLVEGWQALTNLPGVYGPTNISDNFGPEFSAKVPALFRRLFDDVFGNPFRLVTFDPTWVTATVKHLAEAIYEEPAFDRLPILADALEDANCNQQDILGHLRGGGEHCRGRWPLDLVLGRE